MLDSQPGTPTVTATIGSESATQPEVVTAPAAPLALAGAGNEVTFAEGGAPVAVDPALTLTDSQSTTLASATVAISSGLAPGDVLAADTAGTAITASYSAGTLTLSGTDTLADYQAVLQRVTFGGTTTDGGSRTILWSADDGTTTASAVSTVTYTAPPSAPTGVVRKRGGRPGHGQLRGARIERRRDGHLLHRHLLAGRPHRHRLRQPDHRHRARRRDDLLVHRHRDHPGRRGVRGRGRARRSPVAARPQRGPRAQLDAPTGADASAGPTSC